jgi:hypothetical protein
MAQRVTTWVVVGWLAAAIGLLASCEHKEERIGHMPASANSQDSMSVAADSKTLVQQVLGLKELALPDEWYLVKGRDLAGRFDATSRAMRAKDPQAPSGKELMARYENNGQPFVHAVWFNQPLFCPKCKDAGAEGTWTVVSVARQLVVTLTAGEIHQVQAHDGTLPADKAETLRRILKRH